MREAYIERKTLETDIKLRLCLDGVGISTISTGIGFFDHMLTAFAKHARIDLEVDVKGDLEVDSHHTIEDVGIVLGTALKEAMGKKTGMKRYGSCILPMDETLILCAIDFGGRPYLNYDLKLLTERVGNFDSEMVKEFFYAISYTTLANIHIKQLDGSNTHHIIEAAFKAFARSVKEAVEIDANIEGVLSTKGSL